VQRDFQHTAIGLCTAVANGLNCKSKAVRAIAV
jgi:hypothetical protein